MARERVLVMLTPSAIRVVRHAGRSVRDVRLDAAAWEAAWHDRLAPLDQPLRRALGERGLEIDLFYTAPRTVAEILTVPAEGVMALPTASRVFAEFLPVGEPDWGTTLAVAGEDVAPDGRLVTHMVAAGDEDATLDALYEWARRAGARVASCTPIRAALLAWTLREARGDTGDEPTLRVNCGERHVTFVASTGGRVSLIHATNFGYAALADAVGRVCREHVARPEAATPSTETAEAAEAAVTSEFPSDPARLLFLHGVPTREGVYGSSSEADRAPRAADVVAAMQTTLQRLAVETKQAMGQAFDDATRRRCTILLGGPGRAIPRLAAAVSEILDYPIEGGVSVDEDERQENERRGDVMACLAARDLGLSLTSHREHTRRVVSVLRREALVGAAVAFALLGALLGRTEHLHQRAETRLSVAEPRIRDLELSNADRDEAIALRRRLAATQERVVRALGDATDWSAFLRVLPELAGPSVGLTEIATHAANGKGESTLVLRGRAISKAPADHAGVDGFVQRLRQHPQVASVERGARRANNTARPTSDAFEIAVRLRAVPADVALGLALRGEEHP